MSMTIASPLICPATAAHLREIHDWLVDEERRGVDGNFLCNWNVIESCHRDGDLTVCVSARDGRILGFVAGDLVRDAILQVRLENRNTGIGRALVEHLVARHLEADETLLRVMCAPHSSIGFWRRMGFEVDLESRPCPIGLRSLPVALRLPDRGTDVAVTIRFFAEDPRGSTLQAPLATYRPAARRDRRGRIHLGERVQVHDRIHLGIFDIYVEVLVDGRRVYLDQVSYAKEDGLGFQSSFHGWQMEVMHLRVVTSQAAALQPRSIGEALKAKEAARSGTRSPGSCVY
jgi:GNAT superfamily N-acetyltransferase